MVARGDLHVEIGDADLVGIQKKINLHARRHNTALIMSRIRTSVPSMIERLQKKPPCNGGFFSSAKRQAPSFKNVTCQL